MAHHRLKQVNRSYFRIADHPPGTKKRIHIAEALPLWEEIWPGPAMKLVGPLAACSPGLRLALEIQPLEIERHCSADEILQGRLIDLVAFVDVDGAPDIPVEAGVE